MAGVLQRIAVCCWAIVACLLEFGYAIPSRQSHDLPADLAEEDIGSLYLTPYIENGTTAEALRRSRVSLFWDDYDIPGAYSGYVTVNKKAESHLFFLHVKAQNDTTTERKHDTGTAPLLLWLQGGPGQTSLFGQFIENGPLRVGADGSYYRRNNTLLKEFNVVYLDEPVGAGYSSTKDHENGYAKTLEDMSRDVVEFLRQFLQLFPEYNGRDFYVAGESYGSRAALATAYRLHKGRPRLSLNLRGVICGVGFWGSILSPLDVSNYLRALGLLDYNGYQTLSERVVNISAIAQSGRASEAVSLIFSSLWTSGNKSDPTLFQQLTGYDFDGNVLMSREPPEFTRFKELVLSSGFKKAMHVGADALYRADGKQLVENLAPDFFRDASDMAVEVLNNYKVLVYLGQLDPTFALDQTEEFYRILPWQGAEDFKAAKRELWYMNPNDTNSAGYITHVRNFTYVVLARAGHYPAFDQPEATTAMYFRFLKEKERISYQGPRGPGQPKGQASTQGMSWALLSLSMFLSSLMG